MGFRFNWDEIKVQSGWGLDNRGRAKFVPNETRFNQGGVNLKNYHCFTVQAFITEAKIQSECFCQFLHLSYDSRLLGCNLK
jgi:hypothetical protein